MCIAGVMGNMLQDVRYALRGLGRHRGFTIVAVLTLALGIGANTAIFSLVNSVLLRPLPYNDPSRLVIVRETIPNLTPDPIPFSAPDVLLYQKQNRVFESLGAFTEQKYDLVGPEGPQRISGGKLSAEILPMLGIAPRMGRYFTKEEDQPGHAVALLSHGLWQRRFGGDPTIVGKTISLDRTPYLVIGVMPQGFQFPPPNLLSPQSADLWIPMAFSSAELSRVGDNFDNEVLARLKPGMTIERAIEDAKSLAARAKEAYPVEIRNKFELSATAFPLRERLVGKVRPLLLLLLGAVGLLLLIACANVANLLLSRASSRQRELAVRAALGAGRWRVVRQLLTESMLLAFAGGTLGIILCWWLVDVFASLTEGIIPRGGEVQVDLNVLAFTFALCVLTGLLFGIFPALSSSRGDLTERLREGGKGSTALHRNRTQGFLVVAEIALSMVLMVGAGLLIRSFVEVQSADPGFRAQNVLTMTLSLPVSGYPKLANVREFYRELDDRLRAIPGVLLTGAGTDLPATEASWRHMFTAEGKSEDGKPPLCAHTIVSGRYFEALGIPLKAGRLFNSRDTDTSGKFGVLIVNETMAQRLWKGEDPISKRIKWGTVSGTDPWLTVVGVIGDSKEGPLDQSAVEHTYEPYLQGDNEFASRGLNLVVRAAVPPGTLANAVRGEVFRLDRQLPVENLRTMEEIVQKSMRSRKLNTYLLGLFAAVALLLAAVGIYGVMSYSITQRTQEIGIRIALGARKRDILQATTGQGFRLTLAGVFLGVIGALGLSRFLASLLFGVRATDVSTYIAISLFLTIVSLLATYLPARRAALLDPTIALRHE